MIDSLPMANSSSSLNWERSQWDSECERDIATNASRHLPCKCPEPIGRHALNVRATLQRLQLDVSKPADAHHVTSGWTRPNYLLERPAPPNHVNGAKPPAALTRGSFAYTASRDP